MSFCDERSFAVAQPGCCSRRGIGRVLALGESALVLVARQAFWYKAALFSRGPVLALSGVAGKTLEKRGAERHLD